MIDYILGFAFLPVSLLLFANMLGITTLEKIIGIPLILIAAIGLIIVQIANIMSAHINKQFVFMSWILCIIMMWPAFVYFFSGIITFPVSLMVALPGIMAAFLFVEGIYSFYIDHETFK
ncbi:MAG: hypothetical protein WC916_01475 [Candidatus Woesearchaeota archaeon]